MICAMFKLGTTKKLYICVAMFMLAFLIYLRKENNGPKFILLAAEYIDNHHWGVTVDLANQSFFEENQCLHTNCILTTNRTYLPSINLFDAVVIYGGKFLRNNTVPSTRSVKQLYVFINDESPIHTHHILKSENHFYNLTMTYRIDSDIVWSYGLIRDINTKVEVAPSVRPNWKSPPDNFIPDEALKKKIEGKSKKAVWFVSHLRANSNRDNLVEGIRKELDVDIYGATANLTCPKSRGAECFKILDTHYKFYFAFENSLCPDYVTEKLYTALEHDVIPVVYGGADYNRFAPPNSYINVEDFPTTSALVEYLKYLDSNRTEYYKYFWWKKHYEVSEIMPFCQLCALLNTPSLRDKPHTYDNILSWWYLKRCRKPKMVFD